MATTTLRYHGTTDELRLGDQFRIKRWLRREQQAVVCYLPGVSSMHPELEFGDVKLWAYRLSDGTIRTLPFLPEQSRYAPSDITLIRRGKPNGLAPNEPLQRPQRRATNYAAIVTLGFPRRRES